ncbi:TRAP transporter small permease [Halomonas sp. JS92-SW72]|uniref:TRAP transporter small permease n=1 Tax=Halomonas sp. JS92-SW72 TaxID=2306583 RepID=UPI000E5BF1BC|nr:TRAP transporter small permease [Halomonas sp. JS92-SW72]AXY44070.1 TRAP transporter small permease [Halomonas sp. JS92-SW72]
MHSPTTRAARIGRGLQLMLEGVAGATLFGMMLLTTADVTGRYFFNDAIFPARLVWVREVLVNLLVTAALWVMARRVWALAERAFEWGDVTEFLRIPRGYLIGLIAAMLALSALLTLARAVLYLLEGCRVIRQGGPLSPATKAGGPHD